MFDIQSLRNRKKQLKLTNQDIADKAKLPLSTVEQVMCGKVKKPRIDTVQSIERALGIISPDDLSDTQKESITPLEMLMLDKFRQIGIAYGEQGQERAIEILKLAFDKGENIV